MPWSDALTELPLPVFGGGAAAPGEVAGDGSWSPPAWSGAHEPVAAPPDPRDESYASGFAAGLREGERRAEADLRPVLAALQAATEKLEHLERVFERDRAQAVTLLAMAVARALFQREAAVNPEVASHLVQKAIDLLPHDAPIEVRLHPGDLEALRASGETRRGSGPVTIEWIADESLERGDCQVESSARLVDGRVDVALRNWCERLAHE